MRALSFVWLMLVPIVTLLGTELIASCCSSASSNGIGRLLPYERAYVEFFNDARRTIGTFNNQSEFQSGTLRHVAHWQLSHEIHAMARLTNFFLPFVKIPLKTSISNIKTQSGLGEITLGARWPLFGEGFFKYMPGLSLVSSVQIPTGQEPFWLSAGLVFDKSFGALNLSANYGFSLDPTYFSNKGFKPGIKQAAGLQAGFLIAETHRLSFAWALSFQARALAQGKSIPQSSKYQMALSTTYAWAFHSHLTLITGIGAHIPVSYLGKNSNSEIFAQAGLRVGVF